jgi:hypothetical protein
MAQIDKSDFSIGQLFTDNISSSVLNINYNSNFIFAYQINKSAIKEGVIPEPDPQESYEIINGINNENDKKVKSDEETKGGSDNED